jgi:hypothetical protein
MKVTHVKHVWVPIRLVRSRSPGNENILISPSQSHMYCVSDLIYLSLNISRRTATLEDRMHHLESLIHAIPPAVFAAGGAALSSSSSFDHRPSYPLFPNDTYPAAIPPPSLSVMPLTNPSTHFTLAANRSRPSSPQPVPISFGYQDTANHDVSAPDNLSEETARMSLSSSYLYVDDEGFTRWQGETSGLPILDLLIERHHLPPKRERDSSPRGDLAHNDLSCSDSTWFPDRETHYCADTDPERNWKLVTSFIVPDLMDRYVYACILTTTPSTYSWASLVQCYLSTSYYLMPFLHLPTFLNVRSPRTQELFSNVLSGLWESPEMG